jgi:hypothetical protein
MLLIRLALGSTIQRLCASPDRPIIGCRMESTESSSRQPDRNPNTWLTAGAIWLLLAAGVTTFFAWVGFALNCTESCDGKTWQADVQLILALIGLGAAVCMTYWTWVGAYRRAGWALGVSLAFYAVWLLIILSAGAALNA